MSAPTAPISPPVETEIPAEESEETPEIDLGESAEDVAEESAASTEGEDKPDPLTVLQATIDSLTEKIEELRAQPRSDPEQVREAERTRLRAEQDQREQEQRQSEAEREEIEESVRASLIAGGVPHELVDAVAVRKAAERVVNKRYDQITRREINHVSEALRWVRGFAETGQAPSAIAGRAAQYAGQFADDFNAIHAKLKAQAETTADLSKMKTEDLVKRLSADQIKAIHAHENGRLNAVNNNGAKPLRRPEGSPPPPDKSSPQERLDRLASGKETEADVRWWSDRQAARQGR